MIALFNRSAPLTPELEALAGQAMLAAARREGHAKKLPPKPVEQSEDRRKEQVIRFIERHGPSTAREIVRCSGVPRTQVYVAAAELAKSGVLRAVKVSGNTLRYHLAEGFKAPEISPRQQRRLDVLRAMVGAPAVRASEIAAPLGLHRVQVRDVLYIAMRDGEVEKANVEGWPAYRLTHKGLAAISIQAEAA